MLRICFALGLLMTSFAAFLLFSGSGIDMAAKSQSAFNGPAPEVRTGAKFVRPEGSKRSGEIRKASQMPGGISN